MPPLLLLAATEIISGRTEGSERCASRDGEVSKPTTTLLQQVLCARLENQQAGEFFFSSSARRSVFFGLRRRLSPRSPAS
jgi:hypothetical protein